MTNSLNDKWILGIWDGHDSGVAFLKNGKVHFALNEERISRRKMDPAFPKHSLEYALKYLNINPEDVSEVAYSTTDFAKTLARFARWFFKIKEKKQIQNH
jgi:carbamoyltransferase